MLLLAVRRSAPDAGPGASPAHVAPSQGPGGGQAAGEGRLRVSSISHRGSSASQAAVGGTPPGSSTHLQGGGAAAGAAAQTLQTVHVGASRA